MAISDHEDSMINVLGDNSRPSKKRKVSNDSLHQESPPSSPLTSLPSSPVRPVLKPLPPQILLLSLPNLLLLPPNHHLHAESLRLSLIALRKCLLLDSLSPEIECRAWASLTEVGMKVIGGGLSQSDNDYFLWARGVEKEVEKAISKGVLLTQKHPSLRAYRHQFLIIHAQLSLWQQNAKFAHGLLKKLLASLLPSDSPQALYHTHLAIISHYSSTHGTYQALAAVDDLRSLSTKNQHHHITLLSHVLRLRILIAAGMLNEVPAASRTAEEALGLSYEPVTAPKPPATETAFLDFENPFECAMALHTLIIGIVYYTHTGASAVASPRLSHLHALLDAGALTRMPDGVVPIYINNDPPLYIQVTHPRILFLMGFLVSSVSKRDVIGRKPRRKAFAIEGLTVWEKEIKKEISYPPWAGLGDAEEIEERQARIKADLLCELAAVSIMRSEFDLAQETLAVVIAHTRTYSIFDLFSARITLHYAHLAHSLGRTARALLCYRVAARLADKDSFVQISAKLGQVGLMIGMRGEELHKDKSISTTTVAADASNIGIGPNLSEKLIAELGAQATRECMGMGGILETLGQVIEACLSGEILKAKQKLGEALATTSEAQDNHLRGLLLAFISSHYLHTAPEEAERMLSTCDTLAAGMGAPAHKLKSEPGSPSKARSSDFRVGNASLRLWVGERFLELYKRAGKEEQGKKQVKKNNQLKKAVGLVLSRHLSLSPKAHGSPSWIT